MSGATLPDTVGFYSHAVADAADSFGRLKSHVPVIREIGRTVFPADWLPWLIENVGMGAVLPHVPASAWLTVYQQRHWVYYRGTGAAHEVALGWIGFAATYRDGSRGPFYDHFDVILNRYPSHAELPAVVGLSAAGKATASIHHRIIHGHDVEAARGGVSHYGASHRGVYSGRLWREGWPKLSLLATVGGRASISAHARVAGDVALAVSVHGRTEFHLRYGASRRAVDRPGPWRRAGAGIEVSVHGRADDAPWSRLPWTDEPHGTRPQGAAALSETIVVPTPAPDGKHYRYGVSRRSIDIPQESP